MVGEYERTSTVALNARLGPVIGHYLESLARASRRSRVRRRPARGAGLRRGAPPRGGRSAACRHDRVGAGRRASSARKRLGEPDRLDHVIAADMGGTTFKVGMIRQGLIDYQRESMALRYHYALPSSTSSRWGLRAGACLDRPEYRHPQDRPPQRRLLPGPVCYDHGGREPTITDSTPSSATSIRTSSWAAGTGSTSTRQRASSSRTSHSRSGCHCSRPRPPSTGSRTTSSSTSCTRPRCSAGSTLAIRPLLLRRHGGDARVRVRRTARRLPYRHPALGLGARRLRPRQLGRRLRGSDTQRSATLSNRSAPSSSTSSATGSWRSSPEGFERPPSASPLGGHALQTSGARPDGAAGGRRRGRGRRDRGDDRSLREPLRGEVRPDSAYREAGIELVELPPSGRGCRPQARVPAYRDRRRGSGRPPSPSECRRGSTRPMRCWRYPVMTSSDYGRETGSRAPRSSGRRSRHSCSRRATARAWTSTRTWS